MDFVFKLTDSFTSDQHFLTAVVSANHTMSSIDTVIVWDSLIRSRLYADKDFK